MAVWLISLALAGYGDAIGGLPTHAEREMHLWSNLVRVDPLAFQDDYPCSFSSFTSTEQTPKPPLLWHDGLNEVAHDHSVDMNTYDYFDHDSRDGTSWSSRVGAHYPSGAIGENIAMGYGSVYSAVIDGWMCSSGHRANLMSSSWDELGTGVDGRYYTQDFGARDVTPRPIAMGVHLPETPGSDVVLAADLNLADAPIRFEAVLDGVAHPMERILGTDRQGAWRVRVDIEPGCHTYYFEVENPDGQLGRFPQDGSYGWGGCDFDDPAAQWVGYQLEPGPDPSDPSDPASPPTDTPAPAAAPSGCGCQVGAAPTSPLAWGWFAVLLWRRRP